LVSGNLEISAIIFYSEPRVQFTNMYAVGIIAESAVIWYFSVFCSVGSHDLRVIFKNF